MAELGGGELVVRTLRQCGVSVIFSVNGGHVGPIYDACIDHDMRILDVRHEEAAAHMANAWTSLTGEVGVVVVTAGPGMTNAASGIANANASGSPIVLLAGAPPLRQMNRGAFHEMDQVGFMRPITKRSETALSIESLSQQIAGAIHTARSGRPGPTFIELPADIVRSSVDSSKAVMSSGAPTLKPPRASGEAVDAALELIRHAERPVVLAGSGVIRSRASQQLRALVETAQLPVLLAQTGRGAVPTRHPLHFPGARSLALKDADLLLVVGTRFNYTLAYGQAPRVNAAARVIQVDIDGTDIGRNREVDVGILGDAAAVLAQLARGLEDEAQELEGRWSPWTRRLAETQRQADDRLAPDLQSPAAPIHPLRLCAELNQFLAEDAVIAVDGGDILSFARLSIEVNEPGHWFDAGTFGMLGQGVPFANAAKLSMPRRQAVALVGDGAFGFNIIELDTAVRHRLPIIVVVSNNGAWQIEKYTQQAEFGRTVGTDLRRARYDQVVEALGGHGEFVEHPDEIAPALLRAQESGLPACVNVVTDAGAVSPDARRLMATVPVEQTLNYQ